MQEPVRSPLPRLTPTNRLNTLTAISRHLDVINSRIRRISVRQQRVMTAMKSEPPVGVSRLDWIARKLNQD